MISTNMGTSKILHSAIFKYGMKQIPHFHCDNWCIIIKQTSRIEIYDNLSIKAKKSEAILLTPIFELIFI